MKFWNKAAGVLVAGALLVGTGATVMAAPDAAAQGQATPPAAQTQKQANPLKEALKALRAELKQLHEKIVEQRDLLKGKVQTIKSLLADLKKDPDKNKQQLELAKADAKELRLLNGDRKQVNEQLKSASTALKADVKAKEFDQAKADAQHVQTLMQTKLDLLRTMNNKADQIIAHLRAAN
jgi:DNA repair exonuclease SbcCD ATPase subunit